MSSTDTYTMPPIKAPGPECNLTGKPSGTDVNAYLERQNLEMCPGHAYTATATVASTPDSTGFPSHPDR